MPTCYQLIGVPAAGKSTWAEDFLRKNTNCVYISTDHWIDSYAKTKNKTYNEVFTEYMPSAVKLMTMEVLRAKQNKKDIVWDQTSTTVNSRKKKFGMLGNYKHVAVVFKTPDLQELERRLNSRVGKSIPKAHMESMINNFTMPTLDEGFSEIYVAGENI